MIDPELINKLKSRRSVVDVNGTTWDSKDGAAALGGLGLTLPRPVESSSAATTPRDPAAASGATGPPSANASAPLPYRAPPRVKGGSLGNVDTEFTRKLQARRSRVDTEGTTWDSAPVQDGCGSGSPVREAPLAGRLSLAPPRLIGRAGTCPLGGASSAASSRANSPSSAWEAGGDSPTQSFVGSDWPGLGPDEDAEARLWAESRQGAQTWFCEVSLIDLDAGDAAGAGLPDLALQPLVLVLSIEGELSCWGSLLRIPTSTTQDGGLAPPSKEEREPKEEKGEKAEGAEEVAMASALCAFEVTSVLRVTILVPHPQTLCVEIDGAKGPILLAAGFESVDEMRSCASAVASAAGVAVAEGLGPELPPGSQLPLGLHETDDPGTPKSTASGCPPWVDELDLGCPGEAEAEGQTSVADGAPPDSRASAGAAAASAAAAAASGEDRHDIASSSAASASETHQEEPTPDSADTASPRTGALGAEAEAFIQELDELMKPRPRAEGHPLGPDFQAFLRELDKLAGVSS